MATHDIRDTVPIPQPRGLPFVGNVSSIDPELPTKSFMNLGAEYGEIYALNIVGDRRVFVNTVALAAEACDEKRFNKNVAGGLKELRAGVHDGLFTAFHGEKGWETAHRVLVPAFGPLNLHGMFDEMKDVASQMVLKWARYGPTYRIPAADDFTRLTLDTLALCAMDFRFNSFYTEDLHPFIDSMTTFLKLGASRARRPGFMAPFYRAEDAEFYRSIEFMRSIATDLVRQRREHPKESKDLLNAMVNGRDPKTGEGLSEENITSNMITFLIAGHETTSGLLSFLWYYMLKSPEAYRKAQEEVDTVLGSRSMQFEDLAKLPWINAMLRETLRLQPTAPAFTVTPTSEHGEVIGGKYFVAHGESVIVPLHCVHRDPAVYGDDAEEWKPERMLDENFKKLPPSAWKPFGNGARGCIGRPFAWQEALLVVATLLQYFDFMPDDASYDLQVKSTLTIKPKDFFVRATLREGWTALKVEQNLAGAIRGDAAKGKPVKPTVMEENEGIPMTILYGSNSGTCEAFAQTLAADAASHGFRVSTVATLDSVARQEPSKEPTVIITASYEGQPTDNAAHYYEWLSSLPGEKKLDSHFAVFGCGHSDWRSTFHKVPTSIDELLAKHGSERICAMGSADAAKGDMMSEFQTWEDQVLWPAMKERYGSESASEDELAAAAPTLEVQVSSRRASQLRADVYEAKVIAARSLTAQGESERRHIEIQLPSETTYRAGDYLAVLPLNPMETVHRVVIRFGLAWDSVLTLTSKTGTRLPTEQPIAAHSLFSAYLELSQPATKRNLALLITYAISAADKTSLEMLASEENFRTEITEKRTSLLDLLERFPALPVPLSAFITALIPMRVRQYSISSSPLANPHIASLTYSTLNAPSLSGQGRHIGVASNYLSHLLPGDILHVAVKPSHASFHLPADVETTPVIMVGAGTGLAPFRGFIQERAAQIGAGRTLAPAHLYLGNRHPEKDSLYAPELARFESLGAVTIHHAYSQVPELSHGYVHVDDALRADGELLGELWQQGARVYVCGSKGLGDSVREVMLELAVKRAKEMGKEGGRERAEEWFKGVRGERYATDVFD